MGGEGMSVLRYIVCRVVEGIHEKTRRENGEWLYIFLERSSSPGGIIA
jgi:hypothetical protein